MAIRYKNNGRYVYETHNVWNKEKKKTETKWVYLGVVDPVTGEFAPAHTKKVEFAIWKITGIDWASYVGAGCVLTGIVASAIVFAAQTASQSVRTAEFARAKVKGEKPREFKEKTPEFAKIIAQCFRFVKSPQGKREQDKRQICARTRNHARSRRASGFRARFKFIGRRRLW